jgi:hypothetical protein
MTLRAYLMTLGAYLMTLDRYSNFWHHLEESFTIVMYL